MKAWITKYALTAGINQLEGEEGNNGMFAAKRQPGYHWNEYFHGEGKEWHRTREGALRKAEEMRLKRIKSLQKSLQAMESLTFE